MPGTRHVGDERLLAEGHRPGADPVGPGARRRRSRAAGRTCASPPPAPRPTTARSRRRPSRTRCSGRGCRPAPGRSRRADGAGVAPQQPLGLHDDPGRAEAALAGAGRRRTLRPRPRGRRRAGLPGSRPRARRPARRLARRRRPGGRRRAPCRRRTVPSGAQPSFIERRPEALAQQLEEAGARLGLDRDRPAVQDEVHRATPVLLAGTNWPFRRSRR